MITFEAFGNHVAAAELHREAVIVVSWVRGGMKNGRWPVDLN
jgi:hypothetical protein